MGEVNGQKVGFEPFTGERLDTLTPADAAKAGNAPYIIQKFGYSATATKTLSMTFDDGPDPKITPELLNVLSANKAPATFFVTGKNAAQYPEIVARMVREGHAVGLHTVTHPDMASEPGWRQHIEIVATDRVIRSITGQQSGFWRMPFLGDDERSHQESIDALLRAQQMGYTHASQDFDTRDWEIEAKPSGRVADIPMPNLKSGKNITLLMHDAGGSNRQWTIEYVKKLIPYARAHGYTFHTMPSQASGGCHSLAKKTRQQASRLSFARSRWDTRSRRRTSTPLTGMSRPSPVVALLTSPCRTWTAPRTSRS